ncbi:MarR family winged helix-turn-helix transcriptional regulator [Roseivirga sp. BDSF3-8]|uniref:MarR family winged helix-turn-helix transcriptional regulator n=1 Tax=Roseivirga sp. BDSF3-8 TaxID=3241598 RepID=UPI003531EB9F
MDMNQDYNTYSLLLDRTARKVKQYAQKKFKEGEFGITVDQWVVMKQLYKENNLNQTELAERVSKDTPTLTRIIDLLVGKGYVVRQVHQQDRRSFMVHLTKDGSNKVERLLPEVKKIRLKAWENLDQADFNSFQKILNTIHQNLSE